MEMLLPLPCVCQNTPAFREPGCTSFFVSGKALAAGILDHAELLVQLAVQFVAVSDHEQRRVPNAVSRKTLAAGSLRNVLTHHHQTGG